MPAVLVRRDSEFGLLRDLEKRTQILGSSLEGCWGPAPRPPRGGHQQALPNVLAGFARSEAGVAAEGSHCAERSPAQLSSENLSTASLRRSGCFPAEPCPPERHWRIRQGQAVVAGLFVALKIFPAVVGQLVRRNQQNNNYSSSNSSRSTKRNSSSLSKHLQYTARRI
jgi:hypothetical protein